MAETPNRYGPTALTTSAATVVTAPASSTWKIIWSITLCNETDTADVFVTAGINTSAADAAGKRILDNQRVAPRETVVLNSLMIPLNPTEVLYALASAGTSITMVVGTTEGP